MTRILHLSDTHFGTVKPALRQALLRMAHETRPDVLVLSGDVTQRAQVGQFREAKAFCDELAIPRMLAIPGNHDISLGNPFKRFFNPYGDYRRAFGHDLEPVLQVPGLCVIGVRTTRRFRHKNGQVSSAQINRVASRLREVPAGELRIVVVHQPVHAVRAEDAHDGLRNREAAVRAWADAGADIVLGGHIHLPYVADLSESGASHGDVRRRLWCVQAGTALSSRVRWEAPNSVNLINHQPGDAFCEVGRWDYRLAVPGDAGYSADAPSGAFMQAEVRQLALDR
ncbi:MAG: metallophosphoesterase [Comamonadaceae bacterium]|nr:MAG: metallophosphoesterase [Comamonadaceae bacterium]